MKSLGLTSIIALFLLSLTTPRMTTAQTDGPSASGNYWFLLEDDLIKSVEFDARTDARGFTSGYMTFTDQARISDIDDVEDPNSGELAGEIYLKAEIDGLTIEKNRAVMSGTVRDSSHRSYIGKWVQLVVEDNAENPRVPDRLTWGLCKPHAGGWVPTDAERKDDDGAYLRWWATDAERKDDVGVPSRNLISSEERGCQIYPLSWYSFVDVLKWDGDIRVLP
ncbi:MAG TPA: hypothetical protein VIW92_06410 [Thermoanaerobaculia bacterium]